MEALLVPWLSSEEMDMETRNQILNEIVYVLKNANTLEKGMLYSCKMLQKHSIRFCGIIFFQV